MESLKKALSALGHALGVSGPLRARAVRRMKARHHGQKVADRQAQRAHERADALRAKGHVKKADAIAARAVMLEAKAAKEKARAIVLRDRARKLTQRIEGIETSQAAAQAKLDRWAADHEPHVGSDGKVAGAASKKQAAIWVATYIWHACAGGTRPNFYSMTAAGFNCQHAIDPGRQHQIGQVPGERSDCSLFVTEVCLAAGLPDPNGTNWGSGFTGTLVGEHNGWREVSESAMKKKGWGYVVYGSGVGHHTEFYVGEGGDMTIGHGSPPVDPGVINLFGDGEYRCFILD